MARHYRGWLIVGLCTLMGWSVLGHPQDGWGQAELSPEAKRLLKELEKVEVKASDPRLRPAAGKPVVEEVVEIVEEGPAISTAGLIDSLVFEKLSPAQQRLVTSYDNFVDLFPEHDKIPELLYNTGSTYFENDLYPNARTVYERVLNQYPTSGNWYVESLSNIVESYRREKDFQNLEIWSEKLRTDPNAPDSLKEAGEKLAAGAIANQANELARQSVEAGDNAAMVLAAEEYIRTARTYPNAEYAPISLYNAGFTYKKAKVLDKAAEVWLDLVGRYPEITYADTAMWEAAIAYDEAKDFQKAIGVYERFLVEFPASAFRLDALKNRIFDYNEVQDWSHAASSYEQYGTEFPEDAGVARSYNVALAWLKAKELEKAAAAFDRFAGEDPKNPRVREVQFEMGQAYIKQGNLAKANEHFDRFARENPNNPLSVKIHYDIGEYYFERELMEEAEAKYHETIETSQNLKKKKLDGNDFFRGEAFMRLASMTHPAYDEIKLMLPKATLDANFKKKKDVGAKLEEYYNGVILSGSIKGAEAAYRLSEMYVEMADAWLEQETPPPATDILKRQVEIKELHANALGFLAQAIKPLETVNLKRAADYTDIIFDTTWNATHDSMLTVTRVDSSESEWVTKAKTRVPELSLWIAELVAEPYVYFLDHFYEVPITVDKKVRRQIEEGFGKELGPFIINNTSWTQGLQVAEAQIFSDVLPSYQTVFNYEKPSPDGFGLSGPVFQKAHEEALKMLLYAVRMNEARVPGMIEGFEKEAMRWMSLTDSLMYRPEKIRDTFAFGDLLYKILDGGKLTTYLETSLELARQMSFKYENVIQQASAIGIDEALIDSLETHLIRFHYDTGLRYQTLAMFAGNNTNRYFDRVAQIDSIAAEDSPLAEIFTNADASTTLNDMTTSPGGWDDLNFNLRNASLEIYEAGYGYEEQYPVAGALFKQIRMQLSELDPQMYPPPSEEYRFAYGTDTAWQLGTTPIQNWAMTGFMPDSTWGDARTNLYPVSISSLAGLERSSATSVWGAGPDTSGMGADSLIYVRKEFMVFGAPDSCVAVVAATGPYELFMNGFSVGKADSVDAGTPQTFDLTFSIMASSRNTIGIQVLGSSTEQHGLVLEIRGVDRVPLSAENMESISRFYSLPPNLRQLPDESPAPTEDPPSEDLAPM